MPRKPRFNLPGLPQHIIQRGNNRQACFFAEADYHFYLACVQEAAAKYHCDIHAYVLMSNHVHLLVTPYSPMGISHFMQSIGRRYVLYVNNTYQRSGTLWEGRYRACLVDQERYVLVCYRYIELNPVRAGMVKYPTDYPWSSYRHHAYGQSDGLITDHDVYLNLARSVHARHIAYRDLCLTRMHDELLHEIRASLNHGLVLGHEAFKHEIEATLQRSVRLRERGRPRKQNGEK